MRRKLPSKAQRRWRGRSWGDWFKAKPNTFWRDRFGANFEEPEAPASPPLKIIPGALRGVTVDPRLGRIREDMLRAAFRAWPKGDSR